MSGKARMREAMPVTAAWIDKMREVFGTEAVDNAIRRGMRGQQGFHAMEGGHEVGTPVYRSVRIGRHVVAVEYESRSGQVAWQAALDQQAIENEKRG
jgi:hypothetical protein